jgi:hypothetical protein
MQIQFLPGALIFSPKKKALILEKIKAFKNWLIQANSPESARKYI